ncbi:MAG: pyruvate, phosphate dikinase [Chthoniobacterales bacterium]|nr:pyruvate, phosphate dikinase [Chthoniobacterales bacterium]
MTPPPESLTTGWSALDQVLGGLAPGDNVVWSVDDLADYQRLVAQHDAAAADRGRPRVYFRYATHAPLLDPRPGLQIHECHPGQGFEPFVRQVHEVIEANGPGAVYSFDSLSELSERWHSDQATGNFFMLTCPRLRDLETITYFGILRDSHSQIAVDAIRNTTQFLLEVFSLDGRCYLRPIKVQYRSRHVMDTLHEQDGDRLLPVEESAVLARILSRDRRPRFHPNPILGYWHRLFRDVELYLASKNFSPASDEAGKILLQRVQAAYRVQRSGIAPLVEKFLTLEDFWEIWKRQIGVGSIGGKALGMLAARAILRDHAPDQASRLEVHDSFFVGVEVFITFLVRNGVWWIRERQQEPEGFLQDLEEGRRLILTGRFPNETVRQFERMLDYFGEMPCIVRSSSILEDARGNAFSGKYESIFLVNRGSTEERLVALLNAIRRVYASVLDPEALLYRRSRNLLASTERMALLVMRVSGRQRGQYFFPQAAGVGLSYNPYRWDPEIDPEAGVARLVFGLGTRAVDRSDDDYTRLVALNTPLRRPEASLDDQLDHSQRKMDVLDLEARDVVSLAVSDIVSHCGDFPVDLYVDRPEGEVPWVTFRRLLSSPGVIQDLRVILSVLARIYQHPVDIEFTINHLPDGTYRIHLLQCRTFQIQKNSPAGIDPCSVPGRRILEAHSAIIGLGRECPIHDVLYVPTAAYAALPEREKHLVAKLIETLVQRHDSARNLLLIGPGRWGTSSPSLGIPVRAGRIALATVVCEVVAMHGGLIPDVSLGTHFFNDLVEHDLLYMACFPGKAGNVIDEEWLLGQPNQTERHLVKASHLNEVVRWIDCAACQLTLHADPFYQHAVLRLPE